MKTKYKYFLLIAFTFALSILIYNYVEANESVEIKTDILDEQNAKENELLYSTDYSIDNPNVILNPYGISPLSALVVFETKDLTTVTITVKGKDGDNDIVNTFIPSRTHLLPIYGLYADYNNTVIISTGDESKEIQIQTDKLPDNVSAASSLNEYDTDNLFFTSSANGYPVAYDSKGNVRWFLTNNYHYDITRLNNGHLLLSTDRLINNPNYASGLLEVDLLGKIYYEYDLPGGYYGDIFELANGNLLVTSNNFDGGTVEDYFVEIDRSTGSVVKTFDLYDLMPDDEEYNWFGLNSVVYDAKTNSITVCGGNKDLILNIDYTSGEINYIIGEKVASKYQKFLFTTDDNVFPHAPKSLIITENGNFVFINDGFLTEYSVDTYNHSFSVVSNVELGNSSLDSSLSYNKDYGYIVSLSDEVKIIDDEKNVKTVMKTRDSIENIKLFTLYDADIYTTGRGERLGSLGESVTSSNHFVLFTKSDNIIDKYNISMYKDSNRLVVNGTFKKSDDVQIILDNVLDKKSFDVKISSTTYIKDDTSDKNSKIDTTTYINDVSIDGKYYIYLRINGTVYKLYKYIIF